LSKEKEFQNELVGFLKANVPEFDERKKDKIIQAFKSHPVMRMKVKSSNYDS